MQDRFKFRVWDETEKSMVYFDGIFYNKKPYTEGSSFPQYDSSPHYHKLLDLMQSTGFKDKNGKLIYEGDIIKVVTQPNIIENIGVVKWDNKTAQFLRTANLINENSLVSFWWNNTTEVIGNIYENPELLEV